MKILVINCGSSSLKYQLFDMEGEKVLAKGLCERIGMGGRIKQTVYRPEPVSGGGDFTLENHLAAFRKAMELLCDKECGILASAEEIDAVGHRVLHGGSRFAEASLLTPEVITAIEDCIPLAPLHNPVNLVGIRASMEILPGKPMAAVFDTAFHQTMPEKAYIYPIPYCYYQEDDIRRFGFHGSSHKYVSRCAAELAGVSPENVKIISCHLGSGSSICAIEGGRSVDTSMGFTALEGLPMRTRSGDIDPAIIEYLVKKKGLSVEEVLRILNNESGVFAVSGITTGFSDILKAQAAGDHRASLALDIFCYKAQKIIGGYTAAMNGVDIIAFAGGWGENVPLVRSNICRNFGYIGLKLDEDANQKASEDCVLSAPDSKVKVVLVHTNEELVIARETLALIK